MDKIVLRQSKLKHYFDCPYKFGLSLVYPDPEEIADAIKEGFMSDVMREGALFEGYLFGFKVQAEKELIGKKKEETIERIKRHSLQLKNENIFHLTGSTYVKKEIDFGDYALQGEYDYLGPIPRFGLERCIGDVKYTGDIARVWDMYIDGMNKKNFFQSVVYPYMEWKLTGEILPFVYCIVESFYENAIIKIIKVETTMEDFMWFESFLKEVISQDKLQFNPEACLTNWGKTRCKFLEYCPTGRYQLGQVVELNFSELKDA